LPLCFGKTISRFATSWWTIPFSREESHQNDRDVGGEVAGEAGDGLTAIAEFNRISPDIVLMDITMRRWKELKPWSASCASMPMRASSWSLRWDTGEYPGGPPERAKHFVQKR